MTPTPLDHRPHRNRALWAARSRLRDVRDEVVTNLRHRDLRRAQLSFGAAWTSEWALTVGQAIVAFRAGGAAAVGLVALLRLAPGAIAGPFLATSADRVRRERVIVAIGVVRGSAIGAMAVLLAVDAPTAGVYVLAVVSTIAGTPIRAAHSALLPSLCSTPAQLTSANAVRGMLDSLSTLIGPLIAAVLLAVGRLPRSSRPPLRRRSLRRCSSAAWSTKRRRSRRRLAARQSWPTSRREFVLSLCIATSRC